VAAYGGHDRDRRGGEPAQRHPQQRQRVVVEFVQVVDVQRDGPGGGERGEQPGDRGARAAEPGAAGGRLPRLGLGELQRRQGVAPEAVGVAVGDEGRRGPEGRVEGGVRDAPLQPVGAGGEHPPAPAGEPGGGLRQQHGLADAGLAGDEDGDEARGRRRRHRVEHRRQFRLPAHERPGDAGGARVPGRARRRRLGDGWTSRGSAPHRPARPRRRTNLPLASRDAARHWCRRRGCAVDAAPR
jgi:hypothetical protein